MYFYHQTLFDTLLQHFFTNQTKTEFKDPKVENITRTIYGNYLQSCLFSRRPFNMFEYSTLNQKLGINKDIVPAAENYPALGYVAWGNRGHKLSIGADSIAYPDTVPHSATDSALYGQLPFVLRDIDNDISQVEQAQYALRRNEVHDGRPLVAYYLRRLDKSKQVPTMYYTQVSDNQENKTQFWPTAQNLNPIPPVINSEGTNLISADYVSVESILTLVFSERELTEMINVAKILYGKEQLAIMSELALCTGLDRMVTVQGRQFNEAIAVQIAAHAAVNYSLLHVRRELAIEIDVGSVEPLFAVTPVDGANVLGSNDVRGMGRATAQPIITP